MGLGEVVGAGELEPHEGQAHRPRGPLGHRRLPGAEGVGEGEGFGDNRTTLTISEAKEIANMTLLKYPTTFHGRNCRGNDMAWSV